jgi:hypothetical protein
MHSCMCPSLQECWRIPCGPVPDWLVSWLWGTEVQCCWGAPPTDPPSSCRPLLWRKKCFLLHSPRELQPKKPAGDGAPSIALPSFMAVLSWTIGVCPASWGAPPQGDHSRQRAPQRWRLKVFSEGKNTPCGSSVWAQAFPLLERKAHRGVFLPRLACTLQDARESRRGLPPASGRSPSTFFPTPLPETPYPLLP